MIVSLDPEIAKIFSQSTAVSVSKGNSAHLMKFSAKRRRTKQEIQDQKQQESREKIRMELKLAELEALKEKWKEAQKKIEVAQNVENQFNILGSEGKIRMMDDGKMEVVDDPNERQLIVDTIRK